MLRLFDWGPSPFCLKVRSILDYKKLEYERVPLLSKGPATVVELYRRGKIGKVPALDVDGKLVVDSTDIAEELERIAPEPTIYPKDVRDRALGHAIEEWADESLYFVGLYYQWLEPEGAKMVPRAFGGSVSGRAAYQVYRQRVLGQIAAQGTSRKPPEHVARDLVRHLDHANELVGSAEFLFGDKPTLADFALMGQLVYLSRTPGAGPELNRHPTLVAYLDRFKALRRKSP